MIKRVWVAIAEGLVLIPSPPAPLPCNYRLVGAPLGEIAVHRNGLLQEDGFDYTRSGADVRPLDFTAGDRFAVLYVRANGASYLMVRENWVCR